jgi:GTPase SAR1 family protein
MFYRESHIAFVCYDRPEVSSVEKWVSRVREHAPDARVYLVGTKSDLVTNKALEEAVVQEGEQLAAKFRAKYFLTSALAGRNVAELFEAAAAECVLGPREKAEPAKPPAPQEACGC